MKWSYHFGRNEMPFLSSANEVSTGPTRQFLFVCLSVCLSVCVSGLFFKACNWMIYWLLTVIYFATCEFQAQGCAQHDKILGWIFNTIKLEGKSCRGGNSQNLWSTKSVKKIRVTIVKRLCIPNLNLILFLESKQWRIVVVGNKSSMGYILKQPLDLRLKTGAKLNIL